MEKSALSPYKLVVVGGSAGSLEIVMKIASVMKKPCPLSMIIVVHRMSNSESILETLVASKTNLVVKEAEDKDDILPGTIYIAPPDYHLLVEKNMSISLDSSEKIHFSRPSIDATFESAADACNSSLIGILLSGANADGAQGIRMIADFGGYSIVQRPSSADVAYMPQQALNISTKHSVLEGSDIPDTLQQLICL